MSTTVNITVGPTADHATPNVTLHNGRAQIDFSGHEGPFSARILVDLGAHYDQAGYLETFSDDLLAVAQAIRGEAAVRKAAQAATRARYTA